MSIKEEIEKDLSSPIVKALEDEEISPQYLAQKLKRELNAKENKIFMPGEKSLLIILRALKNVGVNLTKDTQKVLSNLLLYSKPMVAWDVRQKARQDAHKLRGDYPATDLNLKHSGSLHLGVEDARQKLLDKVSALSARGEEVGGDSKPEQ